MGWQLNCHPNFVSIAASGFLCRIRKRLFFPCETASGFSFVAQRCILMLLQRKIFLENRNVHSRLVQQPDDESRAARAGRADARLADAPGRPLSARVSGTARRPTPFLDLCKNPDLAAEIMLDDGQAAGRGRGHPLLRPAADPRADGDPARVLRRRRAACCTIRSARPPTSTACWNSNRSSRWSFVMETVRKTRAGLAESLPLIGFAGRPVHAGRLRHRGRIEPRLSPGQGPDVHRHRRMGHPDGPARPGGHALSERPDRRRRADGATVRQLGGLPGRGRLPPLRAAAHPLGDRSAAARACR